MRGEVVAGIVALVLFVAPWLEPFERSRIVGTALRVCGLAILVTMLVDPQTVVETIAADAQRAADPIIERFLSALGDVGTRSARTTTQP